MLRNNVRRGAVAALACTTLLISGAHAQDVEEFYSGNEVTIIVSFGAGGTYGLYGRLIADHIGKHLPGNPEVIVQHMPGAGGIVATNHLYSVAPQDGTVAGVLFKDLALAQAIRPDEIRYDAREFNWIGSVNEYNAVFMAWHEAEFNSVDDAQEREFIVASSGRSHHGTITPLMMNELLGTRFRVITGYDGAGEMHLAMERREADARLGSWMSIRTGQAEWISENLVTFPAQAGLNRSPELPDVPLVLELVEDEDSRQMVELVDSGSIVGWSLTMPPGVPDERVEAWRSAFNAMVEDPEFIAAAEDLNADLNPKGGAEIAEVIERVLSADPAVAERVQKVIETAE